MATATETFAVGVDQFTVAVEIDLNTVWLISGDFSGTIPSGQIGFINGNVNLTGDLIVEGLLTGIDTFTLEGNRFQLLVQNGGVLNLQGVEKSGWLRWGDTPVGWQVGDRLAVAPTAIGIYVPSETTWGGAWGTRPTNSPDVTLLDGSIAKPEVANLSQTITLKNLRRIHFHDGAGVQSLKWLKVLNSGTTGVLAEYPIHFHFNGEASRGSLVEGVVVEGGKNHAFVPHGSHGITFKDCVAYNTTSHAFWWDPPLSLWDWTNNSHDIIHERVLAMWIKGSSIGFNLGAGLRDSVVDSVMTCVQGPGYKWPEMFNIGNWVFERNVAHNNMNNGIVVWQNDTTAPHLVEDFVSYRNGLCHISHGAYTNNYQYRRMVLMGGSEPSFILHAKGNIIIEDVFTDARLLITKHTIEAGPFVVVRRCTFPQVVYRETTDSGVKWSKIRYEDCGLVPANFDLAGIVAGSIIEIYEGSVLTHRWASGVWV